VAERSQLRLSLSCLATSMLAVPRAPFVARGVSGWSCMGIFRGNAWFIMVYLGEMDEHGASTMVKSKNLGFYHGSIAAKNLGFAIENLWFKQPKMVA